MALARNITVCALVAALCACGGSSDENTTNAVDFFNLTIYGASTSFSDSASNVSIIGMAGVSSNTLLTISAPSVTITLSLPAGQTGAVSGTLTTIIAGNSCQGAVSANVTKHGTALGGEVAGTFGPSSIACPIGPTPQTVSGSFSVTHL